jgi:catechol 2,3-dioxygenase-like lactoylglutathione lyase family enzyme
VTDVPRPQIHHVALTVADIEASVAFYAAAFDIAYRMDVPHPGGVGKLLCDDARQLVIVLHRHDGNRGETFTETVTGLDHVGLVVPARADLEAWQDHLAALGVARVETADKPMTQSPIADESYGSVLVFRDPDNIQLELFAPPAR